MNESILQKLFYGKLCPIEDIIPENTNPEARRLNNIISDEITYFSTILSETDDNRFQNLDELKNESATLYANDCFTYRFRLGASLLIEIFYGINNCGINEK